MKSGAELQATMDSQGLFYIPFSADIQYALATTIPDQAQLWHQRFGHVGATALSKMPDLATRITEKDASYAPANPCKTCIKGKFIASPNHNAVTTRYSKYRNYMTLDLYRPVLKTAFRGIKYIYTLLDTATK